MKSYGERLRKLRKESGKTQIDIAKSLEINQSSLSDIEKMEYPPLNRIEEICEIFEIPVWKFFASGEINLPDLTPQQKEWNILFNKIPEELQKIVLKETKNIIEAYELGKTTKKNK
ncbi:MAG: helix-turn-helix domain-containing protein [bacterium]|nr:helix-turn-helix domain-containing protein [bacterium]